MSRLNNVLPLPGITELEDITRGLIRRLKDLKYEDEKQKTLADRLATLVELAKQLDDVLEISRQLSDVQDRFESESGSISRLGRILHAQRKLALWDELDAKINRIVESATLRALGKIQKKQNETQVVKSIENKLPVIPSYKITHQAELPLSWMTLASDGHGGNVVTLRQTARLKKLSVTYKSFASDSGVSVASYVERELAYISRMRHPNIAELAGVTQGYYGLNGYVVVTGNTDGLEISEFMNQGPSGAAMAKYFESITSVWEAYGKQVSGTETVRPSGHVTFFPSPDDTYAYINPGTNYGFGSLDISGTRILQKVYATYYKGAAPQRLQEFLKHCRTLSKGFSELHVTQALARSGIPPPTAQYWLSEDFQRPQVSPIRPGDFGFVGERESEVNTWTSLGSSRHSKYSCIGAYTKAAQASKTQWISYNLTARLSNSYFWIRHKVKLRLDGQVDQNWKDIVAEAHDISQRRNIELDEISLCRSITYWAELKDRSQYNEPERPKTLYFHHNPYSDHAGDFWGFFSASKDPECQTSRRAIEEQGWETTYNYVKFETYNMLDDWGRRHERLVEQGLAAIPGSFPSAHIEEVA